MDVDGGQKGGGLAMGPAVASVGFRCLLSKPLLRVEGVRLRGPVAGRELLREGPEGPTVSGDPTADRRGRNAHQYRTFLELSRIS